MPRIPCIATPVLALLATAALAQPTLDMLWPDQDGSIWEYDYHVVNTVEDIDFSSPATLRFHGLHSVPGGTARVLVAEHDPVTTPTRSSDLPALLRAVWRARPDLREAIASRCTADARDGVWWPLFLHGGYYLETDQELQMWQDDFLHPTWIYATADLAVGATFVHQLVPKFADDIFLYGTVTSIDADVSTPAGEFQGVVRIEYLIDFGWQYYTDENGNLLGRIHAETSGWVHYGPQVGPLDLREEYVPFAAVEGDDHPPEWDDLLGQVVETQTLVLHDGTTPVQTRTLSEVKALFR